MIPADVQAEQILNGLGGRKVSDGYMVSCPVSGHWPDVHPSLHVTITPDAPLFHCHKGCTQEQVLEALQDRNLWGERASLVPKPVERKRPSGPGRLAGVFTYVDADGKPFAIKERRDRPDGGKDYGWRLPDHKICTKLPDEVKKNLPLYHLPNIQRTDTKHVLIVEGEKCADSVRCLDSSWAVTTTPHGASAAWQPLHTQELSNIKDIYLCPDADVVGQKSFEFAARELVKAGHCVRWVDLGYDIAENHGKDIADFLAEPEGAEKLAALIRDAPVYQAERSAEVQAVMRVSDLLSEPLQEPDWVIPHLVPIGCTILGGHEKMGKSLMAIDMAVSVASGLPSLGRIACRKAGALYVGLEDGRRRLQARFNLLTPDPRPRELFTTHTWRRADEGGTDDLDDFLDDRPEVRFVVFDTLQRVRPALQLRGETPYGADYNAVSVWQDIATKREVAIVLVHHLRQMPSPDPVHRLSGTSGLSAAADGTIILSRERGKPDGILHVTQRDSLVGDQTIAIQFDHRTSQWFIDKARMNPLDNVIDFPGYREGVI